jgi:hypothetical protein
LVLMIKMTSRQECSQSIGRRFDPYTAHQFIKSKHFRRHPAQHKNPPKGL